MTVESTSIKRIAAYCRVSTDKSDQINSLESQQKFFYDYINRNSKWELYKIYVDEGLSGTNTKKRVSFNLMISDARQNKFDLILTKEVSRFARNIVDTISYIRELKKYGVGVIFMSDSINSLDSDAELRMGIMASIAQEESRKTSERVKWGHRRSMENGVVFGRDMLGYNVHNGKLYINEDGAEVVRMIFYKYLFENKGARTIAKELREEKIKTSAYMKEWTHTNILRILRNEKYCGDLVQQKTFTPDYLTHSKKYNKGQLKTITIKNHHKPIISREVFNAVQVKLSEHSNNLSSNKYAGRYALSGKIRCGICGTTYTRKIKRLCDGTQVIYWACRENQSNGKNKSLKNGKSVGCDNKVIFESDLKAILQYIISDILKNNDNLISYVASTVCSIEKYDLKKQDTNNLNSQINKLQNKKKKLLDLYLSENIDLKTYQENCCELNKKIKDFSKLLQKENENNCNIKNNNDLCENIKKYIKKIITGDEWSDAFYSEIVDKIIVNEDRNLEIILKDNPKSRKAKILCGLKEIKQYTGNNSDLVASSPISVSVPFNSGKGIVKR